MMSKTSEKTFLQVSKCPLVTCPLEEKKCSKHEPISIFVMVAKITVLVVEAPV